MHKKILISLFLATSLYSQELENEKFQLLAQDVYTQDHIVTASGNVVIYSPTYYLSANKVIYNKQKESLELFDNVVIIKDNNIQTQSNYAYVNLKDESYKQSPLFLYEKDNNIWVNSKKADKKSSVIKLENSIISSCDCVKPDWSIKVSSASYDTKNSWIHTYNPRLYFGGIPVFYSPYFGFPTNKDRRTGLLIPTLGYSSNEGFYYSQPIYYAPAPNYDIEFIPQIRNQRGYGIYNYFRYADSPYSMLKIKMGGFKDKKKYQEKKDLKNQKHYGWNIDYKRTKLFSNIETQDGLYASINYMNDIEYRTLENDDDISSDKKVESKINYFYNTPKYYSGIYAKYYIDTSKDSNDTTLQELPQIHLHKYQDSVFFNKLMYSLDTKFYNYTRKKGLTSNIYVLSLPISYTQYILDEYLYFTVENKTILSKYNYANSSSYDYKNGNLLQNETSLQLGTDLIKPYKDYLHTVNLNAKYSDPRSITKRGDLYKITNDNSELEAFPITQGDKSINLSLNQSLYGKKNHKQIINHKLSQSILYDNDDNPKLHNLENYLKLNHNYGSISNKTIYNVEDKQFIEHDTNMNFLYKNFSFGAGHYKSKKTKNSGKENLESYNLITSYKFSRDYKLSYYENYNLLDKIRNKQGVGLNINDKCWNLNLKFEKEIIPATSNGNKGIDQNIVYINLELKPIGGIKQKYKVDND